MANENYSEKVSVNINSSTLSSIDLLVDHGYYSNRSDFINQSIRSALQQHQTTIDRIYDQNQKKSRGDAWFIGVYGVSAKDIEQQAEAGESYGLWGYGVLQIDRECCEEKFFQVVKDIRVRGKVICSDSIKKHYGLK